MIDNFSQMANNVFDDVIGKYHILDDISQQSQNPFSEGMEALLFGKCWIDTVQWHVEDLVRAPEIDPKLGLEYKRLIDRLNQQRTDTVEKIDDFFLEFFADVIFAENAKINTESPAWAVDRLSILALKIYHMRLETERIDIDIVKKNQCYLKLTLLLEQRADLSKSINELLSDISKGNKKMKVYRQMKMYNDPELNPILYTRK